MPELPEFDTVAVANRWTRDPGFRAPATRAGYTPHEVDLPTLRANLAKLGYYATTDDCPPRTRGCNLRCNRCGTFGATWTEGADERPGWGCLALCPTHMQELAAEHARHSTALRELRAVRYEQPTTVAWPDQTEAPDVR